MNIFILVSGGYVCTFLLSKHYGRKCGDIKCVHSVPRQELPTATLPAAW